MMMGVGNLTELTDVDSAGVNTILAGLLPGAEDPKRPDDGRDQLGAVVGPRARPGSPAGSSCRDAPHVAQALEPRLVALRDPKVVDFGADNLAELQRRIRDPNWRIFAEGGMIYALNNARLLRDPDPFVLFEQMGVADAAHAFYLGYELMKAKTALTLSKTYRQDQALEWGFLTEPEVSHLARRRERSRQENSGTERSPAEAEDLEESDEATA